MQVHVVLEREKGEYKPAMGPTSSASGDLHLTYRTSRGRKVAVLQLLSADRAWPSLYDPKLVELSAKRLRFVGHQRDGSAWYTQEWVCDVV